MLTSRGFEGQISYESFLMGVFPTTNYVIKPGPKPHVQSVAIKLFKSFTMTHTSTTGFPSAGARHPSFHCQKLGRLDLHKTPRLIPLQAASRNSEHAPKTADRLCMQGGRALMYVSCQLAATLSALIDRPGAHLLVGFSLTALIFHTWRSLLIIHLLMIQYERHGFDLGLEQVQRLLVWANGIKLFQFIVTNGLL